MTEETKVDAAILAADQMALVGTAEKVIVDSPKAHESAQEFIDGTYRFDNRVKDFMDDDIQKAHSLHRSLTGKKKILLDASAAARKKVSDAVIAYEEDLAKQAEKEQAVAQTEARKKEEEYQVDRAIVHDEMGMPNLANEILEEEIVIPQAKPSVTLTKKAGLSTVTRWKVEVVSLPALIKDIAKDPDMSHLLKPDQAALNKMATALKGRLKLSGIRIEEDKKKQRTGTRR